MLLTEASDSYGSKFGEEIVSIRSAELGWLEKSEANSSFVRPVIEVRVDSREEANATLDGECTTSESTHSETVGCLFLGLIHWRVLEDRLSKNRQRDAHPKRVRLQTPVFDTVRPYGQVRRGLSHER
jgi:hypothetical protein